MSIWVDLMRPLVAVDKAIQHIIPVGNRWERRLILVFFMGLGVSLTFPDFVQAYEILWLILVVPLLGIGVIRSGSMNDTEVRISSRVRRTKASNHRRMDDT